MNCVLETSILQSDGMLQSASLLPRERRTASATVKCMLSRIDQFPYSFTPFQHPLEIHLFRTLRLHWRCLDLAFPAFPFHWWLPLASRMSAGLFPLGFVTGSLWRGLQEILLATAVSLAFLPVSLVILPTSFASLFHISLACICWNLRRMQCYFLLVYNELT